MLPALFADPTTWIRHMSLILYEWSGHTIILADLACNLYSRKPPGDETQCDGSTTLLYFWTVHSTLFSEIPIFLQDVFSIKITFLLDFVKEWKLSSILHSSFLFSECPCSSIHQVHLTIWDYVWVLFILPVSYFNYDLDSLLYEFKQYLHTIHRNNSEFTHRPLNHSHMEDGGLALKFQIHDKFYGCTYTHFCVFTVKLRMLARVSNSVHSFTYCWNFAPIVML